MTRAIVILLSLAVLLVGCRADLAPGERVAGGVSAGGTSEAINYVHDEARGVGCWFYISTSGSSISCLPDSQYRVTK